MEKKNNIRKELLAIRESLSEETVQEKSQDICNWLLKMTCFDYAKWIYGYMPIRNEADIRPFLVHLLKKGKKIALPRVEGDTMEFYQINSFEDLEEGSYHILEPKKESPKAEGGGFILIPGVAFDREGGRIGYGKGYYDKYFASHNQPLIKIGIAYTIQIVDTIPTTSLDVQLDGLVCEEDLWMFS